MAATREAATTGLDLDTLEMVLSSIRQFAHARLGEDVLLGLAPRDEMPLDTIRDLCAGELGIHLLLIPEESGGLGGGAFDGYRVCEEMARIDLGMALPTGPSPELLEPFAELAATAP